MLEQRPNLADKYWSLLGSIGHLTSIIQLVLDGTLQKRLEEHQADLGELLKDHPELKTAEFRIYPED